MRVPHRRHGRPARPYTHSSCPRRRIAGGDPRSASRVRLQQPSSRSHRPLKLVVAEVADECPWVHPLDEGGLALHDVADAGDRSLVEQRVPELLAVPLAKPEDGLVDVELDAEQVRPELAQRSISGHARIGQQLERWGIEGDGDGIRGFEDRVRLRLGKPPRLTGSVAVPRATHPQMAAQREAVVEIDQQVFPASSDRGDRGADDLREVGHAPQARAGAGAGCIDSLTDQHGAQHRRGAEDRVTLWHAAILGCERAPRTAERDL